MRSSGRTAWASGSPKRTLYSTRRGRRRQHQPGVEHADVGRAGRGEVVEHRLHERRHQLVGGVGDRAPGRRRPCRRCSGRCRPRRCACGPGPAAGRRPCARRTGRAASTPGRSSAPRARTVRSAAPMAAYVSPSSAGTVTPLPAASPSSLTTTGRPSARHHASAASTSLGAEAGERRAGDAERRRQLAGEALRRLQPGEARRRSEARHAGAAQRSATPATSAASGPGITRSTASRSTASRSERPARRRGRGAGRPRRSPAPARRRR